MNIKVSRCFLSVLDQYTTGHLSFSKGNTLTTAFFDPQCCLCICTFSKEMERHILNLTLLWNLCPGETFPLQYNYSVNGCCAQSCPCEWHVTVLQQLGVFSVPVQSTLIAAVWCSGLISHLRKPNEAPYFVLMYLDNFVLVNVELI